MTMVKESKRATGRRNRPAQKEKGKTGGPVRSGTLSRYLLTGAALGLYFGLFFRPARESSLLLVVGLSFVSALAVTLLQLRHPEKRAAGKLLRYFLKAWAGFALVLAMLELRHYFYRLGGRLATTLFTTVYGAGLGLVYHRTAGEEER